MEDLDIRSTKEFFRYIIDITPKYNENPLNCVLDIYEKVKTLYTNELFVDALDNQTLTDMDDSKLLWRLKIPIFNSLRIIDEQTIEYMQSLLSKDTITKKDINYISKLTTHQKELNTSNTDEFIKNSTDFMELLENYMCGYISEFSINILTNVYSSYISAMAPFNREKKEKILAKLEIKNYNPKTILNELYKPLISEFKDLSNSDTPIFDVEQIDDWKKTHESVIMHLKNTTIGLKTPKNNTNRQTTTFSDIIGLEDAKEIIYSNLVFPNDSPELSEELGNSTANFLLLHGPAGTGKTMLARAVASEIDAAYHEVKESIQDKYVGESEKNLRNIFERAKQSMKDTGKNYVIYLDEITSTFTSDDVYSRKLADLFKHILTDDELLTHTTDEGKTVKTYIIGSTNHIKQLDKNLIRPGRALLVEVPQPNKKNRKELWKQKLDGKSLAKDINYKLLASHTDGFSGADIVSIINEPPYLKGLRLKKILGDSPMYKSREILKEIKPDDPKLQITQNIIEEAIKLYTAQNMDENNHTTPPKELFG